MSSEKTAEMFKNKSEEEIINWMVRYMTPEQIKSCFEGEIVDTIPSGPASPEGPSKKEPTVNDLRKYCENKRYVIHKIEGKDENAKVYFWYYLVKSGKWQYSIEPLSSFPTSMGASADECGADTNVKVDFESELKSAYNEGKTYEGELFEEYNEDQSENNIFNQVKSEYKTQGINKSWEIEEITNTLLTAIEIQKQVPVLSDERVVFNFAPVLIEATTETKVYYYYLVNVEGSVKFVYDNVSLEDFGDDLKQVIEQLNLQITEPGQAAAATAKTIDEWKQAIREAANNIDSEDIETIKKNYTEFPLSDDSTFFMKELYGGSSFGKTVDLNKMDLSQYVMNKFGSNTAKLFTAKIISNKFGTKTIALVSK